MTVSFRLATPGDAATVRQLLFAWAGKENEDVEPPSLESIEMQLAKLQPPFECLLAQIDDRPVGLAVFPSLLYSVAAIRQGKEARVFTWKSGM